MLLDRIDIDAHGPLSGVELGPFAEHLNVVSSPEGSGKTAIVRFVRDSLVDREYPLGMMSSSTGRVVWADRNGIVHCRREKDGTATGRRSLQFESRGDLSSQFDDLHSGSTWIDSSAPGTAGFDSALAMKSIQLPECLVDGVITDASVTSVTRVVSACVRAGLDSPETYRSLPLNRESVYHDRDANFDSVGGYRRERAGDRRYEEGRLLREELSSVEAELSQLGGTRLNDSSLVARRAELAARLQRADRVSTHQFASRTRYAQWQVELTQLHDQARRLRFRQSELRRWIAEIDSDSSRAHTDAVTTQHAAGYRHYAAITDENLRRQLDDLDGQMIRWRRALLEIRGLRQTLLSGRESIDRYATTPIDEASLRRMRMDGFCRAIDHYEPSLGWDDLYRHAYTGSSRPLVHLDDIDARIDSATRNIDWLLSRYASADPLQHAWFDSIPSSSGYRSASSLGETLRAIREDLLGVQRYAFSGHPAWQYQTSRTHLDRASGGELEELRHSESWLIAAIEGLGRHREMLIRQHGAGHDSQLSQWTDATRWNFSGLHHERESRVSELDRISLQLDECLRSANAIRRSMRTLPVIDPTAAYEHYAGARFDGHQVRSEWYDTAFESGHPSGWVDRDAIAAEIRDIDHRLASTSRVQWLHDRRRTLGDQLQGARNYLSSHSPLADAASQWLVRLSAGRLQRVDWPHQVVRHHQNHSFTHDGHNNVVTINGRDETQCSGADRALAVIAVRLAAGDLLADLGRPVPLVLETHRELLSEVASVGFAHEPALAYHEHGRNGRINHPITSALRDYSHGGRQVIVLTSHQGMSDQLARVGARTFAIRGERVVHPHRPLWRPQYEPESYVGPHPHIYGEMNSNRDFDINRDFDVAWREAYGLHDVPVAKTNGVPRPNSVRTDWARDGVDHRDGYYFADQYTTDTREERVPIRNTVVEQKLAPESPFFLSVDSPIDQAPSVDAVAAARLRGLSVTHINHLMQQDSNRLADSLGLANVDAATIRRWQAECRLVCRVPKLRGFDARVLVGCGITTPAELAAVHPVDLLGRVEDFLATDRGQQLLLSGSSHELSRLTSWIAAANSRSEREFGGFSRRRSASQRRSSRDGRPDQVSRRSYYLDDALVRDEELGGDYAFDSDRYEYEQSDVGVDDDRRIRTGRRTIRTVDAADDVPRDGYPHRRRTRDRERTQASTSSTGQTGTTSRDSRSRDSRTSGAASVESGVNGSGNGRSTRQSRREGPESRTTRSERTPREFVRYEQTEREPCNGSEPRDRAEREPRNQESRDSQSEHRFYLQRSSPIVDAPSIGARMAERLHAIGLYTVDDLLKADAATVAAGLGHRRIDADTILQWQQQSTLVCRVPMLRGHDAQLLVAAEVTTPEELAQQHADELLGMIDPVLRSSEGKRIVRGGNDPDLDEVTQWIAHAQHHRELRAA